MRHIVRIKLTRQIQLYFCDGADAVKSGKVFYCKYLERRRQVDQLVSEVLEGEADHPSVLPERLLLAVTSFGSRLPLPFKSQDEFDIFAQACRNAIEESRICKGKRHRVMMACCGSAVRGWSTNIFKPLKAWDDNSDLDITVFMDSGLHAHDQFAINPLQQHLYISGGAYSFDSSPLGRKLKSLSKDELFAHLKARFKLTVRPLDEFGTATLDVVWLPIPSRPCDLGDFMNYIGFTRLHADSPDSSMPQQQHVYTDDDGGGSQAHALVSDAELIALSAWYWKGEPTPHASGSG